LRGLKTASLPFLSLGFLLRKNPGTRKQPASCRRIPALLRLVSFGFAKNSKSVSAIYAGLPAGAAIIPADSPAEAEQDSQAA
jgi:hypothetical protein